MCEFEVRNKRTRILYFSIKFRLNYLSGTDVYNTPVQIWMIWIRQAYHEFSSSIYLCEANSPANLISLIDTVWIYIINTRSVVLEHGWAYGYNVSSHDLLCRLYRIVLVLLLILNQKMSFIIADGRHLRANLKKSISTHSHRIWFLFSHTECLCEGSFITAISVDWIESNAFRMIQAVNRSLHSKIERIICISLEFCWQKFSSPSDSQILWW